MMVVPVLITNCQVSLNLNSGPVMIHTAITPTANANVRGRPQNREADLAKPGLTTQPREHRHPQQPRPTGVPAPSCTGNQRGTAYTCDPNGRQQKA